MSELIIPFAIMALTLSVLLGLILCFQKWLRIREALVQPASDTAAGEAARTATPGRAFAASGAGTAPRARPSVEARRRMLASG